MLYIVSGKKKKKKKKIKKKRQKPTGGYSIKTKRIYQKKKGNLDIYCSDKEPEGEFGTMAFTQPCKRRKEKNFFF